MNNWMTRIIFRWNNKKEISSLMVILWNKDLVQINSFICNSKIMLLWNNHLVFMMILWNTYKVCLNNNNIIIWTLPFCIKLWLTSPVKIRGWEKNENNHKIDSLSLCTWSPNEINFIKNICMDQINLNSFATIAKKHFNQNKH